MIHLEITASNQTEEFISIQSLYAQWLGGRVLDLRPRVWASPASLRCGPWARHIYPSLVLVQPRKTRPCLTEWLLMGRKRSKSNKTKCLTVYFRSLQRMWKWKKRKKKQNKRKLNQKKKRKMKQKLNLWQPKLPHDSVVQSWYSAMPYWC